MTLLSRRRRRQRGCGETLAGRVVATTYLGACIQGNRVKASTAKGGSHTCQLSYARAACLTTTTTLIRSPSHCPLRS